MKYNTIRSSVPGNRITGEESIDFAGKSVNFGDESVIWNDLEGLRVRFSSEGGGFGDSKKLQRRLTTPPATNLVRERSSCGGFCDGFSL